MYFSVHCGNVTNGNIGFCACKSCSENKGDCDSDNDCEQGLACGSNNCPDYLGFNSEVDCCYTLAVGHEDFCTTNKPCEADEGDCDSHEECKENIICVSDNCPDSLGFDPETDCCYDNSQSVVGDETFCTTIQPCGQDEGDCDSHIECQDGLVCGSNNCPNYLGFSSECDCCYESSIGDEHFCTTANPCGQEEGDCDFHEECQGNLTCGSVNCPASLGFDLDTDCCYQIVVGDEDFCTTVNPCGQDEGDCNSNEECQTGFECNTAICPSVITNNSLIDCCHIGK